MRDLRVGLLGGLTALVGFAGAASASSIDLLWATSGTPTTSSVNSSSNVQLDVWFIDDGTGTVGGGVTVDYGNSGKLTVVSFLPNPDGHFDFTAGTTTDTGTQVRNINGFNPFGAIFGNARLGEIIFHVEPIGGITTLFSLYTATDGVDNGGSGDITQLGTARIFDPSGPTPTPGATATPGAATPTPATATPATATPPTPPTPTPISAGCCYTCNDGTAQNIFPFLNGPVICGLDAGVFCTSGVVDVQFGPGPQVCAPAPTPTPATPTPPTPTPATPTPPTPNPCVVANPLATIDTVAKGQSSTVNALIRHQISGHIVNPTALGPTAHRIPVCAGTFVTAVVVDIVSASTNTAKGSLTCDSIGCRGVVNVKEQYTSNASGSGDKDSITFLPQ